jgi:hypothetical protein
MFQVSQENDPRGLEHLSPASTEGRVDAEYNSFNPWEDNLDDEEIALDRALDATSMSFVETDAHVGQLDSSASLPRSLIRDIGSFVSEQIYDPLASQQQLSLVNIRGAFTFKW